MHDGLHKEFKLHVEKHVDYIRSLDMVGVLLRPSLAH